MGYRSSVRIITSKRGFDKLKEYSRDMYQKSMPDSTFDIIEDCGHVITGKNFVELDFDDVKWYEGSYADVDSIMDALDKINEEGYAYSYGRIGEEYGDVELRYNEGTEELEDYLPNIYTYTGFYDNDCEL